MKLRSLFLAIAFVHCSATSLFAEPLSYTIIKNPYRFSTYYEFVGKNGCEGRVIENCFQVRTTYDLYDAKGEYESQGICRALSLGALYTWAREIDVYDHNGSKIGLIQGNVLTTAQAKFSFFNGEGYLIGAAYLDYDSASFTLLEPSQASKTLGILKRNFIPNAKDEWNVVLYDPETFDTRLLKIFSTFVVDYQDHFKKDT